MYSVWALGLLREGNSSHDSHSPHELHRSPPAIRPQFSRTSSSAGRQTPRRRPSSRPPSPAARGASFSGSGSSRWRWWRYRRRGRICRRTFWTSCSISCRPSPTVFASAPSAVPGAPPPSGSRGCPRRSRVLRSATGPSSTSKALRSAARPSSASASSATSPSMTWPSSCTTTAPAP
uniref:Uncharacterized protein n=1 Tax=Setaria viridis TaxID=4556 RepID=A0A4U6U336_SETVI|nr:hypothetical protein SEVIR_6G135508v2 [Setaria viridis]